ESAINATVPMLAVDYREGARLGIAIANHDGRVGQYNIIVRDLAGIVVGASVVTLQPRTNSARFLDEMMSLPANFVGKVVISPRNGYGGPSAYVIGLRFTGNLFTTVPASLCLWANLCEN